MQFKQRYLWVVGLFLLLMISGCGGSDGGELAVEEGTAADVELTVQLNDNYFGENPDEPPTWTVATGEIVAVVLTNQGFLKHNWALVEAGAEVPEPFREGNRSHTGLLLFDSGSLSSEESNTVAFQAPAPGTYQVICTVLGHYPSMQATLIVE